MSAAPLRAAARPLTAAPAPRTSEQRREHLRAVSAPQRSRSIAPFAALCVALVLAALGAVLVLNTSMAEGSYEQRSLQIEIADLHQQRAAALTQLEANAAPGKLAAAATALGMEPAKQIGFVSLENDQILDAGVAP